MPKRTGTGKNKNKDKKSRRKKPEQTGGVPDEARRTIVKRLGLFGAYTAPAVLGMAWSDKAAALAVDSSVV